MFDKNRIGLCVSCATIYLSLFSSSAVACLAAIHSLQQPDPQDTKGVLNFTCLHDQHARCTIIVKRDGTTLSTTQFYQGSYHDDWEFNHGAGTYEITVNAYRVTGYVRGMYTTSVYDTATSSITIEQPDAPITLGETRYFYDANGRLEKVEAGANTVTEYEYDDADNRTSKTTTK